MPESRKYQGKKQCIGWDIRLTFPLSLATKGTSHLEVPIITNAHKTEHSTSAAFHGWKPECGPKTGYLILRSGSWLAEVMIWQKFTNVREIRISIGHLWALFSFSLNSQPVMPWSRTEHHSSITDPTPSEKHKRCSAAALYSTWFIYFVFVFLKEKPPTDSSIDPFVHSFRRPN